MAKKSVLSEKNKKIVAAAGGAVFLFVVVYEFFLSDSPSPKPRPAAVADSSPAPPRPAVTPVPGNGSGPAATAHLTTAQEKDLALQQLLDDTTPLDVAAVHKVAEGSQTERKNMFETYKAPPPPPPTPAPPPPIAIRAVEPQTAIAGTPKPLTIKVTGAGFTDDSQIVFAGAFRPTHRVSDTVLSTDLSPSDYGAQRSASVEVKSKSDPAKFYSNQIPFIIQPSPNPPFKNVGRIGDLAVFESGDGAAKQYKRLRRGQTIDTVWRIDAITDKGVDVTDTRYDIKKHVPLEEKDAKDVKR
ncbi:MAG TPA: hypothetical protein VI756_11790 [Blastocatellia bacterium]